MLLFECYFHFNNSHLNILSAILDRASQGDAKHAVILWHGYHKIYKGSMGHGTTLLMHERDLRELENCEGWITCQAAWDYQVE